MKMCEICDAVFNNETYIIEGDWVELDFKKRGNDVYIIACGDGCAEMKLNYCPECGKKL